MTTRRWYIPAYQADNGNVIPFGSPNAVREYAEVEAEALREPGGVEIFVACRDVPDWKRAEDGD